MSTALEALLENEKATAEALLEAERAVQAAKQLKDSLDTAVRRLVAVPAEVGPYVWNGLYGKATAAILEAHDAAEALVQLATLRAEVAATDAEAAYLAVKAARHPDDV